MGVLPANPDDLLLWLVDAEERVRPDRDRFILFRVMGGGQGLPLQHPGIGEVGLSAREQDLEDLADDGYLRLNRLERAWHFNVTTAGFQRAQRLRGADQPPAPLSVGGGIGWPAMQAALAGVGEAYAATIQPDVGVTLPEIAGVLGREEEDAQLERIIYELTRTGYLEAVLEVDQALAPVSVRPTEKAMQVVAGWPGGPDALLDALAARRDATENEEERGRLQRALDGLSGLGREVLSDVLANVITGRGL